MTVMLSHYLCWHRGVSLGHCRLRGCSRLCIRCFLGRLLQIRRSIRLDILQKRSVFVVVFVRAQEWFCRKCAYSLERKCKFVKSWLSRRVRAADALETDKTSSSKTPLWIWRWLLFSYLVRFFAHSVLPELTRGVFPSKRFSRRVLQGWILRWQSDVAQE